MGERHSVEAGKRMDQAKMKWLPHRVHTVFLEDVTPDDPVVGRKYTCIRSLRTGRIHVSIGKQYHDAELSRRYGRWVRESIVAEWVSPAELQVHVHISGAGVHGRTGMRNRRFLRDLPFALAAMRHADGYLVKVHPELDDAQIVIRFHSDVSKYDRTETWGHWRDYAITPNWRHRLSR